jgi:hypothetical protein
MAQLDEFALANRRGKELRDNGPIAVTARYDRDSRRIKITLSSGVEISFAPRAAQGLECAPANDLAEIEISPSGLGLYFPKLNVDLYLPALLAGFLGSQRWAASRLGKLGGSSSSPAKVSASRRNGRLGGRPRKASIGKVGAS